MSKSDQMYMDLEEQATKLGFIDLEDAKRHCYEIVGTELKFNAEKAMSQAHEDHMAKKEKALECLKNIAKSIQFLYGEAFNPDTAMVSLDGDTDNPIKYSDIQEVISYIEDGEM